MYYVSPAFYVASDYRKIILFRGYKQKKCKFYLVFYIKKCKNAPKNYTF